MYPTKSKEISLSYGVRGSWWAAGYHTGTDFRASTGTGIYATKGGRVEFVGYSGGWGTAYGNHIIISSTHNGRTIKHLYAHLSYFGVRTGDRVDAGQYLGKSGNTGNTSGPHLHYEERHSPFGYYDSQRPVLLAFQPEPPKVTVSLNRLQPGKSNDSVVRLKRRLNEYFPNREPLKGDFFGDDLKERYAAYQRNLGFSGRQANGIPGRSSLEKLGFRVVA